MVSLIAMNLSKAAAILGRKGGEARVPKGFATMDPERRKKIAALAIRKRWGKKRERRDGNADNSGSGKASRNRGGNSK
jgi:hypothetical protein